MSSCTTTVPNSVRNRDPVGQTSRQAACVQCLQTSLAISQRTSPRGAPDSGAGSGAVARSLGMMSTNTLPVLVPSDPVSVRANACSTWRATALLAGGPVGLARGPGVWGPRGVSGALKAAGGQGARALMPAV